MPASKHYIVYRETIHGEKDLDIDMRRKTRAGRSSHWEMVLGCKNPLNSDKLNNEGNSITALKSAKTSAKLPKEKKYK